ncbi:MAG: hypothetical protein ACI8QS_000533, partial [Planctomycetota bacterium]
MDWVTSLPCVGMRSEGEARLLPANPLDRSRPCTSTFGQESDLNWNLCYPRDMRQGTQHAHATMVGRSLHWKALVQVLICLGFLPGALMADQLDHPVATAGLCAGAPGVQEQPSDGIAQDAPAELLPQKPVAGQRGIQVKSQLVLDAFPNAPQELLFLHIYPDRTRFVLQSVGQGVPKVIRVLRAGDQVWSSGPDNNEVRALTGFEHDRNLLTLEMRRALYLWPHGIEWSHSEDGSSAEAPLTRATNVPVRVGGLMATLDKDGQPVRMTVFDVEGVEIESLLVETRSEDGFPQVLVIENAGKVTGRETISSHQTKVFYHDHYFLPSSRRAGTSTGHFKRTRSLDLQAVTLRRVELKAGTDWKAAMEQRGALVEEVQAELADGPHQLDPRGCFEIDWSGAPRAILLRLGTATKLPPAG